MWLSFRAGELKGLWSTVAGRISKRSVQVHFSVILLRGCNEFSCPPECTSSGGLSEVFVKLLTPARPWFSSFISLLVDNLYSLPICNDLFLSGNKIFTFFLENNVEGNKEISGRPEVIGNKVSWCAKGKTDFQLWG